MINTLVAAVLGLVPYLFNKRTNVLHAVVGSRIQLKNAKEAFSLNGLLHDEHSLQGSTLLTGFSQLITLARILAQVVLPHLVDHKTKGMGQLVCLDRILQGSGNMVLPDDVFETYRPVFTRRNYNLLKT